MKKITLILGLLFIGIAIGISIGFIFQRNNITQLGSVKKDTIYISKYIEIPENNKQIIDTVYIVQKPKPSVLTDESHTIDSTILDLNLQGNDNNLLIKKDEILQSEIVKIINICEVIKDTLLHKLLDVKTVNPTYIQVEFWDSPLHYDGYKFSKTKLIVYGIMPILPTRLYKCNDTFFLQANKLYYELFETSEFKRLIAIVKPEIIDA